MYISVKKTFCTVKQENSSAVVSRQRFPCIVVDNTVKHKFLSCNKQANHFNFWRILWWGKVKPMLHHSSFFLNDVCQIATLPKLSWLKDCWMNLQIPIFEFLSVKSPAYWCTNTFTNKHIMHKCLKHPEHSPTRLLGSLLTITYRHLPNCDTRIYSGDPQQRNILYTKDSLLFSSNQVK